ncbi:MAG: metallophosphoesterase, partial [Deltaproteobacteria bacterium]|nr:metallophosphoesterase [Deltaproteobacteria bacterium]
MLARSIASLCASVAVLLMLAPGCQQYDSAEADHTETTFGDRPWEVSTEQGEMVLPNVFYAEASENEQIMPTAIDGREGIDRLVYPTIGNPNLYVRDDPQDSLLVVLRLEAGLYAHLSPDSSQAVPGSDRRTLSLTQNAANRLAFYLVARQGRELNTTSAHPVTATEAEGVYAVDAPEIQIHAQPAGMPEPFKRRQTLRCSFRREALQAVPAGLYDLRIEVLRDGQIAQPTDGSSEAYEYQYNAVRIFDVGPAGGEYTVLNVTDTQVSMGSKWGDKSQPQLYSFVNYVNSSPDPAVRNAAFITFNGDLHNGGSPGGIREAFVATTYNEEATLILDALSQLTIPIFLTPGNHDGFVSTGHVPAAVEELSKYEGLYEVVKNAFSKPWPNFSWDAFEAYIGLTAGDRGGWAVDLFVGAHQRLAEGRSFADGWTEVPREDRNMILFDGFHQWRRSYGPLSFSWAFGDNLYVSINSFELRQHRRSGWGMYTVNYGGGMSDVQLEWLAHQLDEAERRNQDVVLLAHHDPRGGHKGRDQGYYYSQVPYRGMGQSAASYLSGAVLTPLLCKLPSWAQKDAVESDCLHDGLQEWMRPDPDFDCAPEDRLGNGRCNPALLDPTLAAQNGRHLHFSGLDLIDQITNHPRVRTLLLGHTHYHSLEMLVSGDEIVPDGFALSAAEGESLAALEVANPVRGYSIAGGQGEYDPSAVDYQK